MTAGARRLAQQVLDRTGADSFQVGRVATTTGTSGTSPVTVRVAGVDLSFPRLASYTPTVGETVLLVRAGGTWVVLGALTGFPT